MLRRLKVKIIVVVMATLLIVFAAVLLVLNLSVYQTSVKRVEDFMNTVIERDGFYFPGMPGAWHGGGREPGGNPQMMRAGRFFYAKLDGNGNVVEMNLEMMYDFASDDAQSYIAAAAESGKSKGDIENFSFLSAQKPYGKIIVFAERSIEINLLEQLFETSIWAAGIASLVLAFLAAFFARWMVAPVKASFDKQQRFISDASHELKTPLTVISANVDVLLYEIGDNARLEHIRGQLGRMNGLVHDLLTLAKAVETQHKLVMNTFDLSGVVLGAVLEFECLAFEEGKSYSYNISDNIDYNGDEKQIKQLVCILVDNAVRYSEKNGQIAISFHKKGSRLNLSGFNTGVGVPNEEHEKIFERFYRRDESRSRETGGYGIGLSIAYAIVKSHRGRISVSGEFGRWIRFDVLL